MGHHRVIAQEIKMTRKPGFIYMYSANLGQEVAFSKLTGKVYCQDGVEYSREELQILGETGELLLAVHLVKNIFKGSEVIRYENRNETNDKRERIEGIENNGSGNASSSGFQIQTPTKSVNGCGHGDYGLY
jgi:hypothetical protein